MNEERLRTAILVLAVITVAIIGVLWRFGDEIQQLQKQVNHSVSKSTVDIGTAETIIRPVSGYYYHLETKADGSTELIAYPCNDEVSYC